jgi:hypothetical protein
LGELTSAPGKICTHPKKSFATQWPLTTARILAINRRFWGATDMLGCNVFADLQHLRSKEEVDREAKPAHSVE